MRKHFPFSSRLLNTRGCLEGEVLHQPTEEEEEFLSGHNFSNTTTTTCNISVYDWYNKKRGEEGGQMVLF